MLIDPVIQRENPSKPYALASTYRRDLWPSRQDAAQAFQNSKVYQRWDPRVLSKWVAYGLREIPQPPDSNLSGAYGTLVTLTTPKAQEVFTFLRPKYEDSKRPRENESLHSDEYAVDVEDYPFYRPEPAKIFRQLPELRPSVLYVFGETSDLSSAEAREQKLKLTGTGVGGSGGALKGHVKEQLLSCGHLVPMECVTECAETIAAFVTEELLRLTRQRDYLESCRRKHSRIERNSIDDKWRKNIGTMPPRRKTTDSDVKEAKGKL